MTLPRDAVRASAPALDALASRYRVERELGGGGMSRVFLAREIALDRDVVLKLVASDAAGQLSAERFAREVLLAARLQQANIVPLLNAGDVGGVPYYTMPFVDGESLRARLAKGRPPLGETLDVLRDVARALAYAHEKGIVHRDVKPENVLLSSGAAMVADFGIAKALSASRTLSDTTQITQEGTSLGTPAYMAPEQALGDEVDARADLYAWGVIAYEMLAGRHPFAEHTTAQRLVAAHIAEVPAPLAEAEHDLPEGIAALVMQCLAKDPAARPRDAGELLGRLSAALTPGARLTPTRSELTPTRARWPMLAAAAAALALAAVLGVRALTSRRAAGGDARSIVVVPFDNLGGESDAYFATGVSEEITTRLARIPGIRVVGRASAAKLRAEGRSVDDIARAVGADFVLTGSVRWDRARGAAAGDASVRVAPTLTRTRDGAVLSDESVTERLTDVFRVQSSVAERVAAALSVNLGASTRAAVRRADTQDPEARTATMIGRDLLARRGTENIRLAAEQFRRALARDSTYARAWAGLAEAISVGPTYGVAFSESPLYAARRAVALDSESADAWTALGATLQQQSHFAEALADVDRALALEPSSAPAHSRRGMILLAQGRVREAEVALRQSVALDPVVAAYRSRLAWVHVADRRADSTIAMLASVRSMDPTLGRVLFLSSPMVQQLGRTEDAIEFCEAEQTAAATCRQIMSLLGDSTRRREAVALVDSAARTGRPTLLGSRTLRASLYAQLGESDKAFAELRDAFRFGDTVLFGYINAPWLDALKRDPRWAQIVGTGQRQ